MTAEDLWRYSLALRGNKLLSEKSLDLLISIKFFFRKYGAGDIYYGYGFELENINGSGLSVTAAISASAPLCVDIQIRVNYMVVDLSNYDCGG